MTRPSLVYRRASVPVLAPSGRLPVAALAEARRQAAPAGGRPLTKSHIPPQVEILAYRGASLIRLKAPGGKQLPPEQSTRTEITEFSTASRKRLFMLLSQVLRACLPFMLTLTYPDSFESDPLLVKVQLDNWLKRLKRAFPTVGGFWKLEFQKRGAAHFHLFLWGLPVDACFEGLKLSAANLRSAACYSEFDAWARRAWYEVVGSGDPLHLQHGTRFEAIRSPQGIRAYVAGYMSKEDQTLVGKSVGRYWGLHNKEAVPLAPAEDIPIEGQDFMAIRRQARRFERANRMAAFRKARAAGRKMRKPQMRNNMGITLVCDADQWLARFPAIIENRRWWIEQHQSACNSQ